MKPKLPKLHLRDLFWLIALVAMGCGWWMDKHRKSDLDEITEFMQETVRDHVYVAGTNCEFRGYGVQIKMKHLDPEYLDAVRAAEGQ